MATNAPANLQGAADDWEDLPQYPSAVCSGIVGNKDHTNGYHLSYDDNPAGNYSIVRSGDKPPKMPSANSNDASAIDMSMSASDMAKSYKNWKRLYDNHSDPRRKYFNAVNCYSGSGDARRLDFVANTNTVASSDHKWHEHAEFKRMYLSDPVARAAYVSIGRGDTVQDWEDSMATPQEIAEAVWLTDGIIRNIPERSDYPSNEYIKAETMLREGTAEAYQASTKADAALAGIAEVSAKVDALATGGIDYEMLATMVADKVRSGTVTLEFVEEGPA